MAGEFATVSDQGWQEATLKELARLARGSFVDHLGLRLVALDADMLAAELPVRTQIAGHDGRLQPGIALAIAEATGMLASHAIMGQRLHDAACLDLSANHCGCVMVGETVRVTVQALCLGRRTHNWEVHLRAVDDRLLCVAKLRIAIKNRTDEPVRVAA
ncbi:PaaI family thioesterase (plasmid) [Bosea vestrisii]|uniref:PaaI family thioesterase n=1 Tax=Bosea vestrisii TaxID=151416 RepID=UPI0024DFF591|nr:PaaI family thioesterase [Bosea vestrisii]WID99795.1 PaaI family thioesterase [Bosea vestrisii]